MMILGLGLNNPNGECNDRQLRWQGCRQDIWRAGALGRGRVLLTGGEEAHAPPPPHP